MDISKCFNCGAILSKCKSDHERDRKIIEDQIRKYERWLYILDKNTTLVNSIEGFSNEKSIAITFLYFLQDGLNIFERSVWCKYFDISQLYHLINLIFDKPRRRSKCIKISELFYMLEIKNKSIEEFSKTILPDKIIECIYEQCDINIEVLGVCCSPWCSCLSSNRSMKSVAHNKYNNSDYFQKYFCNGCHILYGYNKKNYEWQSVDNFVDIINKVLSLVKSDILEYEIMKETGIKSDIVYRAIGYIASHDLASSECLKMNKPSYTLDDILKKFTILISSTGICSKTRAIKLFKWSENEYYYFLMLDEVQEFLLQNSYKFTRKKYKIGPDLVYMVKNIIDKATNSNDLSFKKIAKEINVSINTIRRSDLAKLITDRKLMIRENKIKIVQTNVEDYLENSRLTWRAVTVRDIYRLIGKRRENLNPDLVEWIRQRWNEYNIEYKSYCENVCIELLRDAIRSLRRDGLLLTLNNISNVSGIELYKLSGNKALKKVIVDSRKQ